MTQELIPNELREALLERLYDTTVRGLLEVLESGEAKPADFANAIKLLSSAGISATPKGHPDTEKLISATDLPFEVVESN